MVSAAQAAGLRAEAVCGSPPDGWDEFYAGCRYVHPYQSAAFGEWERLRGQQVAYVSIASMVDAGEKAGEQDGEKVGQCLVSIDPRGIAAWYFGPVLHPARNNGANRGPGQRREGALKALLACLRGCGVVAVESGLTPACYQGPAPGGVPSGGRLRETPVIDLTESDEALPKSFDRAVRKNLRKCRERQAQFSLSEGDPLALDSYVRILAEHRKKLGFSMPPFYPNPDSVRCFAGRAARLLVALASVEGRPVAGLGFAVFRGLAVEVGVAQSAEYAELKLPLHDFIKAQACRELARRGVEIYDLGGVAPRPCSGKEENIRRFKQKFSSRMVSYQSIEVRFAPVRYYCFRGLAKAQRLCQKVGFF
ncbi:MAG TPA: hypothetical protein VEU62_12320 [Bryobacterales bacterium]|nr:hypothetical protein [Bryobacterales bacterium]